MLSATDISFAYGRRAKRGPAEGGPAKDGPANERPANRLRQGYGGQEAGHYVLHNVSLSVERGSMVGLLGPNGSGKTTLLRIVAGILPPLSGRVLIGGESIDQLTRRELARRVAVVPQETHATFDFSVMDMVLMGRYPHLGPFELEGAADQEMAHEALKATGTAA